jgi:[ribosomal protein S5]-alanine N-acetyltransferase
MIEFKIRPWSMADLDHLVQNANNPKIAGNMTDAFPHPYYRENGKAFIEFATRDNPVHIFAIEINGESSGGIGIHPQSDIYRQNAELGYWLAEKYWGNKIISRAIPQVVDIAFNKFNIERIFARPFSTNLASQKVLEKSGFKLEARFEKTIIKNGILLDELVYALRRKQK